MFNTNSGSETPTLTQSPPKQAAVLVDFDLYSYSDSVKDFIADKIFLSPNTVFVLLVSDPAHNDYDLEKFRQKNFAEFSVVLRNTGQKKDFEFKKTAIGVVKEISNLIPVVLIDGDWSVRSQAEADGVLLTLSDNNIKNLYVA